METLAKGTYDLSINGEKRWRVGVNASFIWATHEWKNGELVVKENAFIVPLKVLSDKWTVELVEEECKYSTIDALCGVLLEQARVIESLTEICNSGRSLGPVEMRGINDNVLRARDLAFSIKECAE